MVSALETSQLQQCPVPLQFPFPNVVIATDITPHHWAFYFQDFVFSLSCSGTLSGFMCKVHIALQELQAYALKLHKLAFQLSGKVITLPLDNSTDKMLFM